MKKQDIKSVLTIVIISFKSSKKVEKILNKFDKFVQIIVIENSYEQYLKKIIKNKYKNTKLYYCKNIGYGRAINYASKFVNTKYFYALSPDLIFNINCLRKLVSAAEKLNGYFGVISPKNNYYSYLKKRLNIVKAIHGSGMFFSRKIFLKIGGFDDKIFLFYEDTDYCLRAYKLGYKLYIIGNAYAFHEGGNSLSGQSNKVVSNASNLKDWHGQWSKYYFQKKHYGKFNAILKVIPKLVRLPFQLVLSLFYSHKKSSKYYYQLYGLICSIVGKNSFLRPLR